MADDVVVKVSEDGGGSNKLIDAINRLAGAADKLSDSENKLTSSIKRQGDAAKQAASDNQVLQRALSQTGSAYNAFTGIVSSALSAMSVGKLVSYADSYTTIQNALKLTTKDQNETNKATQTAFKIAQDTYTAFDATAKVYGRVSGALKSMNRDTADAEKITRTISQSVALVSTSAESAKAGLYQFQQALDSGVLRGEEFNSVMENTPGLARALAEGLRVPIGSLRTMAEAGELTSARVITALERAAPKVAEAFKQVTPTVAQAWQVVENAVMNYIGQSNQAGGFTAKLSQTMISLASNINIVAPAVLALGAALALLAVSSIITGIMGLATSFITLATNAAMAAAALGTTFLIPIGIVAAAVAALVIGMNALGYSFTDLLAKIPGAQAVMDLFSGSGEKAKGVVNTLNKSFGDMVGAAGKASGAQGTLAKSTDVVKERMEAWEKQKKKNQEELKKLMDDMSASVKASEELTNSMTKTGAAFSTSAERVAYFSDILMNDYSPAAANAAQKAATLADNLYGSGSAAAMAASQYSQAASAADNYASSASSAASAGEYLTTTQRNFGSQNPYSSGSGGTTGGFSVNANESFALTWDGVDLTQRMKYDVGAQTGYRIGTEPYGTERELLQLKERQKRLDLLKQRFPDLTGAQALTIEMTPDLWAQYMQRYDQSKLDAQKNNPLYGGKTPAFARGGSFQVGGSGGTDSQLVKFWASPDETVHVLTPAQQREMEQDNEPPRRRGVTVIKAINIVTKDSDSFRRTRRQAVRDYARELAKG